MLYQLRTIHYFFLITFLSLKSLHASSGLRQLLMTFVNGLDPKLATQEVGPVLRSELLDTRILKENHIFFLRCCLLQYSRKKLLRVQKVKNP